MGADEIKYHCDRAMAEIDLASRAASPQAAHLHLSLSALHLDRLRRLARHEGAPAPLAAAG